MDKMGILRHSNTQNFCKGITLTFDMLMPSFSSKFDIDITEYFRMFWYGPGSRL